VYLGYARRFGEVEDGLGGLASSMLGFIPPYPDYVSSAALVVVMLGAFVAMQTAGAALTSIDARDRGLGFALVLVAGLGWSSPQLVLMSTLGAMMFIADDDAHVPVARPPATPVPEIVALAGTALGIESSTVPVAGGSLVAARGTVDDVPLALRGRIEGEACDLSVRLGMPGRGAPEVALRPSPGDGGERPTHLLSRTHRVVGSARALEVWGDDVLDTLLPFPTVIARLWPTGAEIDFGPDLAQLDADKLQRLVLALAKVLRG
jgi:hypothetical protein